MRLQAEQLQAELLGVLTDGAAAAGVLPPASRSSVQQRMNFSKALVIHSQEERIVLQTVKSDFVQVHEIVFAGCRVVLGGSAAALCGSSYSEGIRCFFCESCDHDSARCRLSSKGGDSAELAGLSLGSAVPRSVRMSFSKALAMQQNEKIKSGGNDAFEVQPVDVDAEGSASTPHSSGVVVPKASNRGWRAYASESDRQFLQWAVYANDANAVLDFLEGRSGAPVFDVDHPDFTLQTALHRAAQSRCIGICQVLIDHGCNFNAQDVSGASALLILARNGDAKQLEMFASMCR
jgi:hypothetical protein